METTSYLTIISAIVSVLVGLIALIITLRKQFKVIKKTDQLIVDDYLTVEKSLVDKMGSSKTHIYIMGTTLGTLFQRSQSQFIESLRHAAYRGVRIKMMLLDPRADLSGETFPDYTDYRAIETRRVLEFYQNLSNRYSELDSIELRLFNKYSPFFIFLTDNILCFSNREIKRGSYILVESEHKLYQEYYDYFTKLWDEALRYEHYKE